MTNRRRGRKRAALAAAAAVGAAGVTATQASAHHRQTCPGDRICVWENAEFVLPVHWITKNSIDGNYKKCPGCVYGSHPSVGLNDSISAIWNNTDRWVTFQQDFHSDNGGGQDLCIAPGAAAPDLRDTPIGGIAPNWSNRISGNQPGGPAGCDTTVRDPGCSV